jgi:hypothetical protein
MPCLIKEMIIISVIRIIPPKILVIISIFKLLNRLLIKYRKNTFTRFHYLNLPSSFRKEYILIKFDFQGSNLIFQTNYCLSLIMIKLFIFLLSGFQLLQSTFTRSECF